MEFTVQIKIESKNYSYRVEADNHYSAKVIAMDKCIEDNVLPGTPSQYISGRLRAEFEVRATLDRRRGRKDLPDNYYLSQTDKLRKKIRESEMPENTKRKASALLLELRGVLSGE